MAQPLRPGSERARAPTASAEVEALRLLARVAVLANEAPASEPCLAAALRELCEHGGWDAGHAWLVDSEGSGELVASGIWHLADACALEPLRAASDALRLAPGVGFPGAVAASGQAVLWRDAERSADPALWIPSRAAAARECGIRSGFAFPIRIGRETAGVLEFFSREQRDFDPATVEVLAQVGLQLGRVIERERATAALARREAQLRSLFDSLSDTFVAVVDPETRIEDCFGSGINRAWAARFGKLIGQRSFDYLPAEQAEPVAACVRRVVETGEAQRFEQRFDMLEGGQRVLEVRCYPVHGEDGSVDRVLTTSRDVTERREAERALRESERRFQALADAAPMGIARLDAQGRIVYRNQLLRLLTGISDEDARGERWLESLRPQDRDEHQARLRAMLAEPSPHFDEHAIVAADGSVRWVFTRTVPERDAEGRHCGFVCCVLDISERKAAEEALRQSEHRFQSLAEALPVGIWRTDRNGRFTDMNRRMAELLEIELEGALGTELSAWLRRKSAEGRIDPGQVERALASRERSLDANAPVELAFRWRLRDGSERWFQLRSSPELDADGASVGRVGTVVDVTERRRAEDALRESERRYQSLADVVPVGISRLDRAGRLVYRNRLMEQISGFSDAEMASGAWLEALGPGDPDAWRERIQQVLAFPGTHTLEYEVRRPDGSTVWVLSTTVPEFDDEGRFTGIVSCVLDISDRRAAENALRESERRFQTLAEAVPVGVWRNDADGRLAYMNRRQLELVGLEPGSADTEDSPSMVSRLAVEGRLDRSEATRLTAESDAAFASQRGKSVEMRVRGRDGSERWLQLRIEPEFDPAGRLAGFVGASSDVTELKRVEEALRTSEHRFHTLAESLPVGVWRTDREGRSVYENRRMAELLDMGSELLVGRNAGEWMQRHLAEERMDAETARAVLEAFSRAVRERASCALSYRWRLRDGGERWLHLTAEPELDEQGNFVGHVGTISDVTERRLAEQALRESEHHYQTLAEAMGVGVYRMDPEGRTVYANRRLWEMLERVPPPLPTGDLAKQLAAIAAEGRLDAEGIERLGLEASWAIENQRSLTTELNWRAKDGSSRWILLRAEPEFDAEGGLLGFVTTATDVSGLKRAEHELARHRDHLGELVAERTAELERSHEALRRSERLAAVGTFAAGIAHQINNPVGGILLAAQFAKEAPADRERVAQSLSDIEQDAKHVGRIVRGVLEFARGPSREMGPCDLNAAIAACAEALRRDVADRGAALALALEEGLPAVLGSETALEQVVTNLVWNAIEAGATRVRVRTASADDGVVLAVEDDGAGIAEEDVGRVFDPLFTTRSRRGGTGLGLALAHGIVHAHGGRISLESRRGAGTTVTIQLPRA